MEANDELRAFCATVELPVRPIGSPGSGASITPHAVREFADPELEWLIHRQIYLHGIDILQLEYTPLVQYAGRFERLASVVFEHDIYFQSIARGLAHANGRSRPKGCVGIPARPALRTRASSGLRPGAGLHASQP